MEEYIIEKSLPYYSVLLYGSHGLGKTTTVLNFIKKTYKQQDYIVLNASIDKGINTVRETIKTFCERKSNINIVILDESDAMTIEAQKSLLSLLDTKSRFILICNYLSKIIIPIQSRCICINFKKVPTDKLPIPISNITNSYDGDIRKLLINHNSKDIIKQPPTIPIQNFYDKNIPIKNLVNDLIAHYDLTNLFNNLLSYMLSLQEYENIKHLIVYYNNLKNKGSNYIELVMLIYKIRNQPAKQ